jgi:two-component system, OmpR family, sensor histidine kinase KdpD
MNIPLDNRPNPDDLLASIIKEEEKSKRGKLKIFFGMCAGVGKTYAMLQTAHLESKKGADIVIGYIEHHNRKETAALVDRLDIIPRMDVEYKGTKVQEMDLDAIIARKPQVVLVDELAHTNAPGSRHAKRYQDVMEILDNGINVYTTLNVQHLESRSETVAQITGITVRETLPDEIFENADEVEVIDIVPDELLVRLSEGKIYNPERSKEAVQNFFRKGNITALREMALRIVADRVDKQLHDYMQHKRIRGPWKSGMHLLVAVSPSPYSASLLRWAKNLAYTMGAEIQSVYVEMPIQLNPAQQEQLDKNIDLAKQLGIKFRIITHHDLVKSIVDFAQKENVSHIIIGKPRERNLKTMFHMGNFVNKMIRYSGHIDVYIYGSDESAVDKFKSKVSVPAFTSNLTQYFTAVMMVILSSAGFYLIKDIIGYQVVSFGLLFIVSLMALFYGVGPILISATLSALIWDYFFIPPQLTFHIDKPVDMLMFIMFFIIALLNGTLTSRIRGQEKKIRIREERTDALYQLTKELLNVSSIDEVSEIAKRYFLRYFKLESIIINMHEVKEAEASEWSSDIIKLTDNDVSIVNWVQRNNSPAGKYTDTLPSSEYTFYPLKGNNENMGVVVIRHPKVFTQGESLFWYAILSQLSSSYEREFLRATARKAYILNESDKLYKTLFNSISHELRIPVSTIVGVSDTLMSEHYPVETQQLLLGEINTASLRLNRLIENLLNMSRLESGHITLRKDWCDINDLANKVYESLKQELSEYKYDLVIQEDMPLVQVDFGLMEQSVHNLLLNATQNSPIGTTIRLKIFYDKGELNIQVMDRGKGFPESELNAVFNKFYRGKNASTGGTGLGLSIVKGFVEAHDGTVTAQNRAHGGAIITIKIPSQMSDILAL